MGTQPWACWKPVSAFRVCRLLVDGGLVAGMLYRGQVSEECMVAWLSSRNTLQEQDMAQRLGCAIRGTNDRGRVVLLHLARWSQFTILGYLGIVHNCTQFEINFPDLRMNFGMAELSEGRTLGAD